MFCATFKVNICMESDSYMREVDHYNFMAAEEGEGFYYCKMPEGKTNHEPLEVLPQLCFYFKLTIVLSTRQNNKI